MTDREKMDLLDKYFQRYKEGLKWTSYYMTDLTIRPTLIHFTKKSDLIENSATDVMITVSEMDGLPVIRIDSSRIRLEQPVKKKVDEAKKNMKWSLVLSSISLFLSTMSILLRLL